MRSASTSRFITCRPGQASGIRSNTRLFSFITQNWRGKPLVSYQVIIDLIAATTTDKDLKALCELDTNTYDKGIVVTDTEMDAIHIVRAEFHGEWNYTIKPCHASGGAIVS